MDYEREAAAVRDYHAALLRLQESGLATPALRRLERMQARIDDLEARNRELTLRLEALVQPPAQPGRAGALRLVPGGQAKGAGRMSGSG